MAQSLALPTESAAPGRARRFDARRVMRDYSFSFGLILAVGLLIANIAHGVRRVRADQPARRRRAARDRRAREHAGDHRRRLRHLDLAADLLSQQRLHRLARSGRPRRRRLGPDHARARLRGRRLQRAADRVPAGPAGGRHARDVLHPPGCRPRPLAPAAGAAGQRRLDHPSRRLDRPGSPVALFTIGVPLLIWFGPAVRARSAGTSTRSAATRRRPSRAA